MTKITDLKRRIRELEGIERGLRADLQGMCTQDADHVKDLTTLRVSLARVAQSVNVLHIMGIPEDSPYEVIYKAAITKQRGWNALAAAIAHEIGHLHAQVKQHEDTERDAEAERLCTYYRIEREQWDRLDEVVQHALYRVARENG